MGILRNTTLACTVPLLALCFGCNGTDADISHVWQSGDGKTAIFEIHRGNTLHVVTMDRHLLCGASPFAMSQSGSTVVAAASPQSWSLVVTRFNGQEVSRKEAPVSGCLQQAEGCLIEKLRCTDDVAMIQIRCNPAGHGVARTRWFRMSLSSLDCEESDMEAWGSLHDSLEISGKLQETTEGKTWTYQTTSGMRIVNTHRHNERCTVMRLNPDSSRQELIREDDWQFFGRQLHRAGYALP